MFGKTMGIFLNRLLVPISVCLTCWDQEMFALQTLCNAPLARERCERSRRRERRRNYAFPRR